MKHKLFISIICNIIIFYFVGLSNIWAHEKAINNKNIHPLQDFGFEIIPYDSTFLYFNDYILGLILLITSVIEADGSN